MWLNTYVVQYISKMVCLFPLLHLSSKLTFLFNFSHIFYFFLHLSILPPLSHSSSSALSTHIIFYPFLFISLPSHSMALSSFLTFCPLTVVSDFPRPWILHDHSSMQLEDSPLPLSISLPLFHSHSRTHTQTHGLTKNTLVTPGQRFTLIKLLC